MSPQETEVAEKIGNLIKVARKRKNLTQASVARHLGVSQSALSKMESGILVPSAPQWFSFCSLTGIRPESLVSGECLESAVGASQIIEHQFDQQVAQVSEQRAV